MTDDRSTVYGALLALDEEGKLPITAEALQAYGFRPWSLEKLQTCLVVLSNEGRIELDESGKVLKVHDEQ